MKSRIVPFMAATLALVVATACADDHAGTRTILGPALAPDRTLFVPPGKTLFVDRFTRDQGWQKFEEIVDPACYGSGLGSVNRVLTPRGLDTTHGLRVWADSALSTLSNHLIAGNKVATHGLTGVLQYTLSATIDSATARTGQAGPEFSMQDTKQDSFGAFHTHTAGIQYVANMWMTRGFQLWTNVGGYAGWKFFQPQSLTAGETYTFILTADFTNSRYVSLQMTGAGISQTYDLSTYSIVPESKWNEEAFWITAESENLWHCGQPGAYQYRVNYSNVVLAAK